MPGSPPSRQAEDENTVGQIGSHQSFAVLPLAQYPDSSRGTDCESHKDICRAQHVHCR